MYRKLRLMLRVCMVLVLAGTLYMIWLIADITWKQYQDTQEWQNTAYTGELKDVEPFLAKNYVNTDDREAVAVWQKMDAVLDEIDSEGRILEEKTSEYEETLARSIEWQEKYGLTSGDVVRKNNQLLLYLELEKALKTAYEAPAAEPLQQLTNRLYGMQMETNAKVHANYFERLREIALVYSSLSDFLTDLAPVLGNINDGILSVNKQVNQKTTQDMVDCIEENGLQKFPFIRELHKLLESSQWTAVLKRNEITRAYEAWEAARGELESYGKSGYYAASSVVTYQQALELGLDVHAVEKDGYTIDPNSPVYAITYNGVVVTKEQYIAYGTPVVVTLKEKYIKEPEKPEEEKPDEEIEDEKPDSRPGTNESDDTPADKGTENKKPDDWDDNWEDEKKPTPTKPPSGTDWDADW